MLYGLQWLMICIPIVITSTFIAPPGETVFYTQKLLAVMGITMIVQALWGHRMPLVAGPAAVLLMGVITASAQGHDSSTIYPSMMVGGAIVAAIAASGAMSKMQRLFTPRIVVSILLLISFTTANPIIGLIFSDNDHQLLAFIFSIACVLVMAVANNLMHGIWKTTVVIWAMILGSVFYYCITGFPSQFATDTVEPQLINSPVVRAEPLRFKESGVHGVLKDVFIPWYNAYRFLLQNIKYWETKTGEAFHPSQEKALSSTNVMDRWLLVRFHRIG